MCITGEHQIGLLERAFELVDSGVMEDWETLTLAEVFARTVRGAGFGFELIRGINGRPSAVVLISVEPRSMQKLETLFGLS